MDDMDDMAMMRERTQIAQNLVRAAREIEQVLIRYDLHKHRPEVTTSFGRTIFASNETVLEGYIITVKVPDPSEAGTFISFSIYLDENFERVKDDELSVEQAAVLGMET